MDAIDRAIIGHLRVDARISNVDLAHKVGLSPSPCLRRVRILEETGVITGYHVDIDPHAIGRGFEVLVHANMAIKNRRTVAAFEARIAEIDAIIECRRMFGDPDYLLWVAVADADAYEQFYMDQLTDLPGVARLHTQFTMKVVKGGADVRRI